ncbi:MAG: hypothetical protein H7840_17425 [Alphaproteobacteria bacterium]
MTTTNDASQEMNVPAKFRDPATGEIRVDALLKSYLELERRLGSGTVSVGIPGSPDEYGIQVRHKLLASDPDVNTRLHKCGFSNEQAQLVYDLAAERVIPMLEQLASQFEAERHMTRLTSHFGGEEKWSEIARQLKAWGEKNLPPDVLAALASSHEGVVTLHRMMASGEPGLMREGAAGDDGLSEDALKKMMEDPRYWRDKDPAYVNRVSDGYRRLFPGTA